MAMDSMVSQKKGSPAGRGLIKVRASDVHNVFFKASNMGGKRGIHVYIRSIANCFSGYVRGKHMQWLHTAEND